MGIIAWLVLGLIAGFIANKIMGTPGGLVRDIILGIVGAFVGGWIMAQLDHAPITRLDLYSILVATGGAIVVVFLVNAISGKKSA